MTLHHAHRRNYLAHNQQEIPAPDRSSSHKVAQLVGCLRSSAQREPAIFPDESSKQGSQHSLNLPEVLPAPFKPHKPLTPCRLPSSRCI
jgi:hypothetical protein